MARPTPPTSIEEIAAAKRTARNEGPVGRLGDSQNFLDGQLSPSVFDERCYSVLVVAHLADRFRKVDS